MDKVYRHDAPAHESPNSGSNTPTPGKASRVQRRYPAGSSPAPRERGEPHTAHHFSGGMNGEELVGLSVDAAARSNGAPLPDEVRGRFEQSLGADLSSVRVHTGAESAHAARAVGAKAYTTGQDIHFGAGQYQPSDAFGLHLLAHEVAHTVQQRGGPATTQYKLEVSSPGDAAEVEADRAADAMVAGRSAQIDVATGGVSRKLFRLQDTDEIMQSGDAAAQRARGATLAVDNASVTVDRSRVGELIAEIKNQDGRLKEANNADTFDSVAGDPVKALATNAATKAALEIFDDSLQTSNLDTKAFAVQFRIANADYQRLQAEAAQFVGKGIEGAADELSGDGMKLDSGMAQYNAFRTARKDLNTAATKMEGKISKARGAASALQGALYSAKAAAAKAKADAAKSQLAAIRAQIAGTAANVSKIVKLASGVAGLAGGGGATSAMADGTPDVSNTTIERSPDNLFANPHKGHYVTQDVHVNPAAESASKAKMLAAMGSDVAGLADINAAKLAEKLVQAVGQYAEKDKIADLQAKIATEEAVNKTFKAAANAKAMAGKVDTLQSAAKELSTTVAAFESAKAEMTRARNELMAALSKQGAKGRKQAKAVLFLSDADKFLAQAKNAISVGKHQQTNLKRAAEKRKGLRGTTEAYDGKYRKTQTYYRCHKTTSEGTVWGTNDHYRLTKVDVTLGGSGGFGYNDRVQGGRGSVEGAGGAGDVIAQQIKTLENQQKQVQALQSKVQSSLGVGGPGMHS